MVQYMYICYYSNYLFWFLLEFFYYQYYSIRKSNNVDFFEVVFNNFFNNFDERYYVYDGQFDLNDWIGVYLMCIILI